MPRPYERSAVLPAGAESAEGDERAPGSGAQRGPALEGANEEPAKRGRGDSRDSRATRRAARGRAGGLKDAARQRARRRDGPMRAGAARTRTEGGNPVLSG